MPDYRPLTPSTHHPDQDETSSVSSEIRGIHGRRRPPPPREAGGAPRRLWFAPKHKSLDDGRRKADSLPPPRGGSAGRLHSRHSRHSRQSRESRHSTESRGDEGAPWYERLFRARATNYSSSAKASAKAGRAWYRAAAAAPRYLRWNGVRWEAEGLVVAAAVCFVAFVNLLSILLYCVAFREIDLLKSFPANATEPVFRPWHPSDAVRNDTDELFVCFFL